MVVLHEGQVFVFEFKMSDTDSNFQVLVFKG